MGRFILILTLGSFVILGIIQRAVNNRQITMTEGNVETFMVNQGRNATGSALELAINRIFNESDWGNPPLEWEYDFPDFTVRVNVDDHDVDSDAIQANELRITSSVNIGNRVLESTAFIDRGSVELPNLDGALSVYGTNSRIRLQGVGAHFKIDGNDTNPEGITNHESEGNVAGIASVTPESTLFTRIAGGASGKDFYVGEPDFDYDSNLEGSEVNALYQEYIDMKNGQFYSDGDDLGSNNTPTINIIGNDAKFTNNEVGAGILVVKPDATLEIGGNFTYNGLILVAGKLEISGTPRIYGGVMLLDTAQFEDGSTIEEPEEGFIGSGNAGIMYSSWVLDNLRSNLSGSGSSWALNRILY